MDFETGSGRWRVIGIGEDAAATVARVTEPVGPARSNPDSEPALAIRVNGDGEVRLFGRTATETAFGVEGRCIGEVGNREDIANGQGMQMSKNLRLLMVVVHWWIEETSIKIIAAGKLSSINIRDFLAGKRHENSCSILSIQMFESHLNLHFCIENCMIRQHSLVYFSALEMKTSFKGVNFVQCPR